MNGMTILTLGVGDAFSARYYSSCLALRAADTWLLVDCPHPVRKIVSEAAHAAGLTLDVQHFCATILTHLHGDHCSGVEGLGFYCRYIIGRKARLVAHPTVAASLWSGHLSAGMEWSLPQPDAPPNQRCFDDFFELFPLEETRAVSVGPFQVECRFTLHSVPTTALRISAGGRCLGFSADTAFDPTLLDWLTPSDLIVHETSKGHLHTPYADLAALPAELRRKMRLIHYPDDFDVVNSNIRPLRQGELVEV